MQASQSMESTGGASGRARAVKRLCGARTRQGGQCKRTAGWGTDHAGTGRCKNHGGSSPNGKKAAARQLLDDFMAASQPLADVDPIDALLYAVRRSSMRAAWLRAKLAAETDQARERTWAEQESLALVDLARFSKMALDAGVAERRVRIAEQLGEMIATAVEESLAEIDLPARQRARFARAFQSRLALLEATADEERP